MPLKKTDGNMYPWVTHTHSHLGGACPHQCSYCYVQAMASRFPNMKARYSGVPKIYKKELAVNYGSGRTIFLEHMNDLFASGVSHRDRMRILAHAREYRENKYVFQTKNPAIAIHYRYCFWEGWMIGTTIETNRQYPGIMGNTPPPSGRMEGMEQWCFCADWVRRFVTVEPILDFDVRKLSAMIRRCKPEFVNIGADSKGTGLPEPRWEKVQALIDDLSAFEIEIRQKRNLDRLKEGPTTARES